MQVRTFDGRGNNTLHPEWGSAGRPLRRDTPVTEPPADLPNPRTVSNQLFGFDAGIDPNGLTDYVWTWGQFLDHDIVKVPDGGEFKPIPVPKGDTVFDPESKGTAIIPFTRTKEQLSITSTWIDASMVYGSDADRAAALRTMQGGKLRTSEGDMLPWNVMGLPNENPMHRPEDRLFAAGDIRANENGALTSLHVIFLREHNRLCDELSQADPSLSDEELYQQARKLVGAQVQAISYNEFLPAMVGPLPEYRGYREDVDPSISSVFTTAAYRVGHCQLWPAMPRIDQDGKPLKPVMMDDISFNPERLAQPDEMDYLLRGMLDRRQPITGLSMIDSVRNRLFGAPGQGGLDLAAVDIERGRDHDLPGYNEVRASFGLPRLESFSEITPDRQTQDYLGMLYGTVDRVDPFVGMMAEAHLPGLSLGPTLKAIITDQFVRLRDGDRFWYQNDPELKDWQPPTLAEVIARNSGVKAEGNVFVFSK